MASLVLSVEKNRKETVMDSQGESGISLNRAVEAIIQTTTEDSGAVKKQEIGEGKLELIEADGRRKYFLLREEWSFWIIRWITVLTAFNIALTVFVGLGVFQFENMQWFISAIMVETFLQIVGMGYIAVKFLFSDKPEKP